MNDSRTGEILYNTLASEILYSTPDVHPFTTDTKELAMYGILDITRPISLTYDRQIRFFSGDFFLLVCLIVVDTDADLAPKVALTVDF